MKTKIFSKLKKKLIPQIVALVASALVFVLSVSSLFAWFVANPVAPTTGMQLVVTTDKFDILVDRGYKYDEDVNYYYDSGYEGVEELVGTISAQGYVVGSNDDITSGVSKVALELFNERVFEGQYYLMPSSYGTLTFYINSKVDEDFTADITVDLGGFLKSYVDTNEDGVSDSIAITDIKDLSFSVSSGGGEPGGGAEPESDPGESGGERTRNEVILDLLKGHILFFTDRTGLNHRDYEYTGLIDGSFEFSTENYTKINDPEDPANGYYRVTLYWEWPVTFNSITNGVGTRYPSDVSDYISENPEFFFLNSSASSELDKENSYNDGDQTIGDNLDYIVVYLDVL